MSRLAQLLKLVRIAPDDALTHYSLGLEYAQLGQLPEAIAAFEAALRVDENYSAAYYQKAKVEIGLGRFDAARATLRCGTDTARNAGDWHTVNEMQSLAETIP